MSYQRINPDTGKVVEKFKEITNKQLESSLITAAIYFDTWRFKTFSERAIVATKAATILRARVDDFVKADASFARAFT
jgi:succinate-semialdehyde dehydrogenase/glutarate-semialdehyde dehydrogenase